MDQTDAFNRLTPKRQKIFMDIVGRHPTPFTVKELAKTTGEAEATINSFLMDIVKLNAMSKTVIHGDNRTYTFVYSDDWNPDIVAELLTRNSAGAPRRPHKENTNVGWHGLNRVGGIDILESLIKREYSDGHLFLAEDLTERANIAVGTIRHHLRLLHAKGLIVPSKMIGKSMAWQAIPPPVKTVHTKPQPAPAVVSAPEVPPAQAPLQMQPKILPNTAPVPAAPPASPPTGSVFFAGEKVFVNLESGRQFTFSRVEFSQLRKALKNID